MIPESEWVWQGHPAHLCVADRCQFRLNTKVGKYIISTVGEWYPLGTEMQSGVTKPQPIGAGDDALFETYVFLAGKEMECGCVDIASASELVGRRYATAREAHAGHMECCRKYAALR